MTQAPRWKIERILKQHQRTTFSCGHQTLDEFLSRHARQNDAAGLGRTYVATEQEDLVVRGYYTLAAASVAFREMPQDVTRLLPRYPVPVVLIARLAVDTSQQGRGLGKHLLLDAMRRSLTIADQLGVFAVAVEAKDDQARAFYSRYGFRSLTKNRMHLFMQVNTIRKALCQGLT